jgi:glutamate transport system permease protein
VALVLGTLVAAMRVSPVPPLRALGTCTSTSCATRPLTVVFFIVVFGLPEVDVLLSFFRSPCWRCRLHGAVRRRGGAVRHQLRAGRQAEASRAVGMTFGQTLRIVVLPQAFANACRRSRACSSRC